MSRLLDRFLAYPMPSFAITAKPPVPSPNGGHELDELFAELEQAQGSDAQRAAFDKVLDVLAWRARRAANDTGPCVNAMSPAETPAPVPSPTR